MKSRGSSPERHDSVVCSGNYPSDAIPQLVGDTIVTAQEREILAQRLSAITAENASLAEERQRLLSTIRRLQTRIEAQVPSFTLTIIINE